MTTGLCLGNARFSLRFSWFLTKMMSENHEIWNLSALCRCCHSDGHFKSLQKPYSSEHGIEIYSQMLQDSINVEISPPILDVSYTICDLCILRLRDAFRFKQQVLLCETKFAEYCKNELASRNTDSCIKAELDSLYDYDDDNVDVDDFGPQIEIEIKCDKDIPKKEENDDVASIDKKIKSEEDNKDDIKIEIPKLEKKNDAKGTEAKKKGVRKKSKTTTKKSKPYDGSLEVHVQTETGLLFSCKSCGGSYQDQKELKRHILSTHLNNLDKFKCLYCDERFPKVGLRNEHHKSHPESAVKCAYCDKVFHVKTALKDHEKTHNRPKIFQCDLCEKQFAYKASLKIHLRGHYGTKKQCICHLCGHGFNDATNLRAHIQTVHEKQRPFSCHLCPKSFTAKKHLKLHLLRHAGEPPFFCDQCPKRFFCNASLKHHKLSHMDKYSKFTCKVCRKRFSDRSLFAKHLRRSHIGQKPFKCHICEKDFVCKYSLKRHVIEHSGEKPFQCDQCDAKFSQRGALKRHTDRKHVIVKDVSTDKCEVCNKLVVDLKKHMLCHNNKKFACEYCDKSYSENNVLTRHKRIVHFGIKPHVCEFCDKKYVKITGLRNHQLKVHKVVSKVENDEDFDSAVAKFSIKNKKGKIKMEGAVPDLYVL